MRRRACIVRRLTETGGRRAAKWQRTARRNQDSHRITFATIIIYNGNCNATILLRAHLEGLAAVLKFMFGIANPAMGLRSSAPYSVVQDSEAIDQMNFVLNLQSTHMPCPHPGEEATATELPRLSGAINRAWDEAGGVAERRPTAVSPTVQQIVPQIQLLKDSYRVSSRSCDRGHS